MTEDQAEQLLSIADDLIQQDQRQTAEVLLALIKPELLAMSWLLDQSEA